MFWLLIGLWLCGLAFSASAADTYSLADGTTLTGDIVTFTDAGIIFRTGDDKYTPRMPWTQFSQEGLQELAQNPKIRPMVEPFMELPPVVRAQPTDNLEVHEVTRLSVPVRQSLLGALTSSSVGVFLLLLIYAANLYAAFEVAVCRARPIPMVMGISALLPVVGPAIFFCLPTNMAASELDRPMGGEAEAQAAPAAAAPTAAPAASQTAGASGAATPPPASTTRAPSPAPSSKTAAEPVDPEFADILISVTPSAPKESPVSQVFKRGQFTFNRRFFETKFAGFMQVTRSEADQKLHLILKIPQGEFVVERFLRVGTGDLDFETIQGGQAQVVTAPFGDIQEINLKSKPA